MKSIVIIKAQSADVKEITQLFYDTIQVINSDVSITAKGFFEKHGFDVEKQQFKKSKNNELINFRMVKRIIHLSLLTYC